MKHKSLKLDIPLQGTSLIYGPNGSGKSTIFDAILYALYGKVKKPYTHGTTTCKVKLFIPSPINLNIIRTGTPNVLKVTQDDVVYEDDAAQGVIDTSMGVTAEQFLAGCYKLQRKDYMRHHSNVSLLALSSADQMKFIEKLAFSFDPNTKFKAKITEEKKALLANKTKLEGELKAHQTILTSSLVAEPENWGLEDIVEENLLKEENDVATIIKTESTSLASKKNKLSVLKTKEEQNNKILRDRAKLEDRIKYHENTLRNLPVILTEEEITLLQNEKLELEKKLGNIRDYSSLHAERKRFEEIIKEYKNSEEILKRKIPSSEKLEEMKTQLKGLVDQQKRYDDITKQKREASIIVKNVFLQIRKNPFLVKKLKDLPEWKCDSVLEVLRLILKEKEKTTEKLHHRFVFSSIAKDEFCCPGCNEKLRFSNAKLIISSSLSGEGEGEKRENQNENQSGKDFRKAKALVDKLSKFVSELSRVSEVLSLPISDQNPDVIEALNIQLSEAKSNQEKLDAGEPSSMRMMKKRLDDLEKKLSGISTGKYTVDAIKDMERKLFNVATNIEKNKTTLTETGYHITEIERLEDGRDKLLIDESISMKIKDIENAIDFSNGVIRESGSKLAAIAVKKSYLERCKKYQAYLDQLAIIEKIKTRIDEVDCQVRDVCSLESLGKQAEILTIEQIVKRINYYSSVHLSKLLIGMSLMIKIERNKLIFSLFYNGEEYPGGIKELSGGEQQLADFAFFLGIGDMMGSKIRLIDENFVFVDPALNLKAFNYLCTLKDKTNVVISHESIKGTFDSIVDLGSS